MNTPHPRARARRRLLFPYRLLVLQGRICKVPKNCSIPDMKPPTPATLRDILEFAALECERPRDLLDRLRGADRQWQLDHA